MVEVECDNCGELADKKPAKIERNERVFCSRDCYHDFGRPDLQGKNNPTNPATEKVEKTCDTCGDAFEVYPHREDSARFCSRECKDNWMAGKTGDETPAYKDAKETYTCDNCGDDFQEYPTKNDAKFCSKSCYREASEEIFAGDGNPVWRGGRVDNYGPNWDRQREQALERDGHTCRRCGTHADDAEATLHVHHEKRLGWFKEEYDAPEWWQKGNALPNLTTLCRSCHMKEEWSDGLIRLSDSR